VNDTVSDSSSIEGRERALRAWFTRGAEPIRQVIDGLDIGWGGVQSWATARMPPVEGLHLDVCCGYATFLAQLGWRHPEARLVGLNIDFGGPHALAPRLLAEAGVSARLVQADGRALPFLDATFDSVSCFLGLQDVEIGFGREGVGVLVAEAVRVLRPAGVLTVLDEFSLGRLEALLEGLPVAVTDRAERGVDARWDRGAAERAVALYAEGWAQQTHQTTEEARLRARSEAYARMKRDMEEQLRRQGYYVPFGPIRMLVAAKIRE
jgi:SAM-dependent methyltransferase